MKKYVNKTYRLRYIVPLMCMLLLVCNIVGTRNARAKTNTVIFDDGKLTYQITDEKKQTVVLTGSLNNMTDTKLVIPSKVTYKSVAYTVTEINYDSDGYYNDTVKEIVVPETVVGDVVIRNSVMSDECYDSADVDTFSPFLVLDKITFLTKEVPSKIYVQAYVYDHDFIIEVPAGKEEAFAKKFGTVKLTAIKFYDRVDSDHTYYTYNVPPAVLSSTQKKSESTVFSTEHGVYLVTKSAKNGQGEVKLIRCSSTIATNPFRVPNSGNYQYPNYADETIESKVTNDGYSYVVTSLAKNALSEVNPVILTIPDTITDMDTPCINPYKLKALFLSNNCKNISGKLFAYGEVDDEIPLIYIPPKVDSVDENVFFGVHVGKVVIPDTVKLSSASINRVNKVDTYTFTQSDVPVEELTISNTTVSATIQSKKKLDVEASNSNSTDTINYVSMDNGTALVTAKGEITPAHYGTGFVVAYSVLSGKHQIIRINVKDKIFTNGIFTYRINYSTKKTVTLIGIKPTKKDKKITIPSSVKYKGTKYTVTKICAGKSIIDDMLQRSYTVKDGYIRTYDYDAPLISDSNAKKCNVTQITIPSTVTTVVSNLGKLTKLNKVVFDGKKAPKIIALSIDNLKKATLYVPKYSLKKYQSVSYRYGQEDDTYISVWSKSCIAKLKKR